MGDQKGPEGVKGPEASPGDGIRSMKTTKAFQAFNFELYMRPNKTIMALGLAGMAIAVGYLTYINYGMYDKGKYYYAEAEDGSKIVRPKVSRWDS